MDDPIQDYIILAVPRDFPGLNEATIAALDRLAYEQVMGQYKKRRPRAILIDPIKWYVTSDPAEVERRQPAHKCATCLAGNDQAQAFLREHPDRTLALGDMVYREIW